MAYITNFQYYTNNGTAPTNQNWGEYQYVSMADIINNFTLFYVGNDKQLNNAQRREIIFHTKRGIQELNYDAIRNIKILELTISGTSQMVLPPDYVNFVRISLERDGVLFPMIENKQTNFSNSYLQDNNYDIVFDVAGNVVEVPSQLDIARLAGDTGRIYTGGGPYNGRPGWCIDGDWFFGFQVGGWYGLDPETANWNVTYKVDSASGVINFSSDLTNQNVVLEYISDGMDNGNDQNISINKLAEQSIYAYIKWQLLENKTGVPVYDRSRAEKAYLTAKRNAKIRLSNIHPSRLLMVLRGQEKWIK